MLKWTILVGFTACILTVVQDKIRVSSSGCLMAQAADGITQAENTQNLNPDEIFRNARQVLNSRNIIAASIRESVLIHQQRYQGAGHYLEKIENQNRMLRMEMSYSGNDCKYSVMYVSDGRKFWISKNIAEEKSVCFVDTFKLTPKNANPNRVSTLPGAPIALGGLSLLLSQIENSYHFVNCEYFTEKNSNVTYILIKGNWKKEKFPFQEAISNDQIKWGQVPAEIPDSINVYLGVNDLFPYRISYFRTREGKSSLISTIGFSDVSFLDRLFTEQFRFEPPEDVLPMDLTEAYKIKGTE